MVPTAWVMLCLKSRTSESTLTWSAMHTLCTSTVLKILLGVVSNRIPQLPAHLILRSHFTTDHWFASAIHLLTTIVWTIPAPLTICGLYGGHWQWEVSTVPNSTFWPFRVHSILPYSQCDSTFALKIVSARTEVHILRHSLRLISEQSTANHCYKTI